MYRVLFVCLGNICRSPMAEGIFLRMLADAELDACVRVASAGTAAHHAGEAPDPRTAAVLARRGEHCPSRAARVEDADFESYDLILAMDGQNLRDLQRRCPAQHQHKLSLALRPTTGGEVPDPYYGGRDGFDTVYRLLEDALECWLDHIRERLAEQR